MKSSFEETCLALLSREFAFFRSKIPKGFLLLRSGIIAMIICLYPCVSLADTICKDCPEDDGCVDKWGNPMPCPPDDGGGGDDGGGDDGGGDDGPCFDKWGNPTDCPNDPCPDGTCCPAPGFGLTSSNIAPAVAEAADCGDGGGDGQDKCVETEPAGSWLITTYFSPIESDFSGSTTNVTFEDGSTADIKQSFINRIQTGEGWGAVDGENSGYYMGAYDDGIWEKGSQAEGQSDIKLTPCKSLATRDFSLHTKAYFEIVAQNGCSAKICGERADAGAESIFYPGAEHIDLYVGTKHLKGMGTPEYEEYSATGISVAVEE